YIGLKFLRRPLRFFGAIGLPLAALGALVTAYLVVERLLFGEPLADRPALVFSVMMVVLGVQIVALGLIGEIVIFSSTRRMRTYEIDTIIRGRLNR
ncbi:MAG: glycosyl transferase family 2, partial [Armatimonadota bacterium]